MIDNKENDLFIKGIKLFNKREFYDAHESWEELWLEYHLSDKKFIQALIQLTVGYYHLSTGNIKGALSLLNKSLDKIKLFLPSNRGIDTLLVVESINKTIEVLENDEEFIWDIVIRLEISN